MIWAGTRIHTLKIDPVLLKMKTTKALNIKSRSGEFEEKLINKNEQVLFDLSRHSSDSWFNRSRRLIHSKLTTRYESIFSFPLSQDDNLFLLIFSILDGFGADLSSYITLTQLIQRYYSFSISFGCIFLGMCRIQEYVILQSSIGSRDVGSDNFYATVEIQLRRYLLFP